MQLKKTGISCRSALKVSLLLAKPLFQLAAAADRSIVQLPVPDDRRLRLISPTHSGFAKPGPGGVLRAAVPLTPRVQGSNPENSSPDTALSMKGSSGLG